MKPSVRAVLDDVRRRLTSFYGDRLVRVILYGSEARGEAKPGSDIDLLVLLRGPFDRFDELRTIVDLLYPLQLASDRLISARPVSVEDYEHGTIQLYRNARADGIAV